MLQVAIYAIAPYKDLQQMEDNYNKELRSIAKWEADNPVAVGTVKKESFNGLEHFLVWYTDLSTLSTNQD